MDAEKKVIKRRKPKSKSKRKTGSKSNSKTKSRSKSEDKKIRTKSSKSNTDKSIGLPNITGQLEVYAPKKKDLVKLKEQKAKKTVKIEKEKTGFNYRRNKTTGTFTIYTMKWRRYTYSVGEMFLPFGLERFGDGEILNVYFKVLDNFHHNFLVSMKEIDRRLENIPNTNTPFDVTGMEYKPIIKENHYTNTDEMEDMRYYFRCHLAPGVQIRHKQYFGNYDKNALKGKRCDIKFDLGSIWIHNENNTYGCTIYITDIFVKN